MTKTRALFNVMKGGSGNWALLVLLVCMVPLSLVESNWLAACGWFCASMFFWLTILQQSLADDMLDLLKKANQILQRNKDKMK